MLEGFSPGYLDIEPGELVRFLLRESGQLDRNAINPAEVLACLRLEYLSFDFRGAIPPELYRLETVPRALLSFPDRIVAVDARLSVARERFSVLHEVAHYVLPGHQYALYLCDDMGLSSSTKLILEKEANDFAAALLFHGDRFTLEANSAALSAARVKELATSYEASFVATARRLTEKSIRPCMLVVFERMPDETRIDLDAPTNWKVKYCAASPSFKSRYFTEVTGTVSPEIAVRVARTGVDIADSVVEEIQIGTKDDSQFHFRAEFFYNQFNILCLLIPQARVKPQRR